VRITTLPAMPVQQFIRKLGGAKQMGKKS
jgi:hypothetical protein